MNLSEYWVKQNETEIRDFLYFFKKNYGLTNIVVSKHIGKQWLNATLPHNYKYTLNISL